MREPHEPLVAGFETVAEPTSRTPDAHTGALDRSARWGGVSLSGRAAEDERPDLFIDR